MSVRQRGVSRRFMCWMICTAVAGILIAWLAVWLVDAGTRGVELASTVRAVTGLLALIVSIYALRWPATSVPTDAKIVVANDAAGHVDDDTGVMDLTQMAIAVDIWGSSDPATAPNDSGRLWTQRAQESAATDPTVAAALTAARNIVPDYRRQERIGPYGALSQRDWWIGVVGNHEGERLGRQPR